MYCTSLQCTAPHCSVLHLLPCGVDHSNILHFTRNVPHSTAMPYTAIHSSAIHSAARHQPPESCNSCRKPPRPAFPHCRAGHSVPDQSRDRGGGGRGENTSCGPDTGAGGSLVCRPPDGDSGVVICIGGQGATVDTLSLCVEGGGDGGE